ncbi:MAG TPA: transposase [Dermatophilaceae bacterium]|nr:transposase [Dermatophilaceae bacterium]
MLSRCGRRRPGRALRKGPDHDFHDFRVRHHPLGHADPRQLPGTHPGRRGSPCPHRHRQRAQLPDPRDRPTRTHPARLAARAARLFDTDGASNGSTEATNLVIEKGRRTAHGYRNFANYRLRLLLRSGVRASALFMGPLPDQ